MDRALLVSSSISIVPNLRQPAGEGTTGVNVYQEFHAATRSYTASPATI